MKFSTAEENYIKTVYHLQQIEKTVNTNSLADALQTSPASVTDMIKKLKRKRLVNYTPYYGCNLTSEGEKLALFIIRKHRLWEYFLAEKLGFNWEEVHEIAEELEHIKNEKLIDRLDSFLGRPRFDPHGDPIPDVDGTLLKEKNISLANAKEQFVWKVTQIADQSSPILDMLTEKKIGIGTIIEIRKKYDYNQSLEIKTSNKTVMYISKELSENIFVKKHE